jgi:hypothetical protein
MELTRSLVERVQPAQSVVFRARVVVGGAFGGDVDAVGRGFELVREDCHSPHLARRRMIRPNGCGRHQGTKKGYRENVLGVLHGLSPFGRPSTCRQT